MRASHSGHSLSRFIKVLLWVTLFLIFASPAFGQLDEKEIDYDAVFAEGFQRGGTVLNLSGKKIGDEGLERLLKLGDKLKKVKSLDLRYCKLSEKAGNLLAKSGAFPNLKKLEIRHNFLMDIGTVALADAVGMSKLEKLGLGWNEVRDAGALALAKTDRFPKLKKLDLRGNFFADKTKSELKEKMTHLKNLKLEANL